MVKKYKLVTFSKFKYSDDELFSKINDFLLESSIIYPSIGEWWKKQVVPGLKSGERVCQIITDGDREQIAALSIIKNSSKSAKLCTLRVKDEHRDAGLGKMLLGLALNRLLSKKCNSVHYTISEEVMRACNAFFLPYGFMLSAWSKNRYVKGKDELIFSITRKQLQAVISTMKNPSTHDPKPVLLSIKPEYADLIEQGRKHVEFRRRFSATEKPTRVFFYVTAPAKEIRFSARIDRVVKSTPESLWKQYQKDGGIQHDAFSRYFKGSSQGSAVLLSNITPLEAPIKLHSLRLMDNSFVPPQSHRIIRQVEPLFALLADDRFDREEDSNGSWRSKPR